jgi:hypothetical protein
VVKCLTTKCKVLGSILSPKKEKIKPNTKQSKKQIFEGTEKELR